MKAFFIVLAVIGIGWWMLSSDNNSSDYSYPSSSYSDEVSTIDRSDALYDYWDEIAEYLDGSYTVIACSENSGNCYDLEAEIDDGEVSTLNFSNGGYVGLSGAEVDSNGEAVGCDDDDCWTIEVDENDIDDALDSWADNEGIILE